MGYDACAKRIAYNVDCRSETVTKKRHIVSLCLKVAQKVYAFHFNLKAISDTYTNQSTAIINVTSSIGTFIEFNTIISIM